jgi:hypothetical protein
MELPVVSYAVAGCPGLSLPAHRTRPLPPPGPRGRKARLPSLALELARCAVGERELPETTAVLFGTALGCLTETEAFLENMITNNEETPMPRAFSASVHNAMASRVAITLGARGTNRTYVHGEVSFAQACRFASSDPNGPVLIGALDEFTAFIARGRFADFPQEAGAGSEGGAVILCRTGEPPLAVIREARFGGRGELAAWLRESGADLQLASRDLGPEVSPYPPLVGRHPSSVASAVAAAVALLAGDLQPSAFGRATRPHRIAVGVESRLGDLAMIVLDRGA